MQAGSEGSGPTLGDAASPGAHQLRPICFSTPGPGYTPHVCLGLSMHGGCTLGSPMGARKLPQHLGQRG